MNKTVTVKGIGRVSAKPDWVELSMQLETISEKYEDAVNEAAEKISALNAALEEVGFEKESVKTTSFNVNTRYNSIKDKEGNYRHIFEGYIVKQNLKVEFSFDNKHLAETLSAVASCVSKPELSIRFTVKKDEQESLKDELLRAATKDAKHKASLLVKEASPHKRLGDLINVNYNWGELSIFSPTSYQMDEECMADASVGSAIDIEPDDIDLSDTVAFTWEIK